MKPFIVNFTNIKKCQSGIPFSYSSSKLVDNQLVANDVAFDEENKKTAALLDLSVEEEYSLIVFAKNKKEAKEQVSQMKLEASTAKTVTSAFDIQGLIGTYGTVTEKEKLSPDFYEKISGMCTGRVDLHSDNYRVKNSEHTSTIKITSCNEMPLTNGKSNSKFKIEQDGVSKERRTYMLYYEGFTRTGDTTSLRGLTDKPTPTSKPISFLVDWTFQLDSNYVTDNLSDNERLGSPLKFEIKQIATAKGCSSPDVLSEHSLKQARELVSNMNDYEVKKGIVLRDYLVAKIEKNDSPANELSK
ncbi:hypothetical protein NDJ00_11630 [Vibrio parahaemolyticus]|uniref:hypothetical protein n=1 Tax=Vibrio parahaemolyticus TaxID=670 RepID=UPI0006C077DA|nr:hypothetical protein [Vibrio parahaemolyticus]EGR5928052.1 hypothetical protein [Vibrio parahaemolyticus]KOY38013.1 hypothetical protein ACX10_12260 [Vibrio parahaemolyticus]MCS0114820.1 hypothetical protein [Vibrio parahaemolyticus]